MCIRDSYGIGKVLPHPLIFPHALFTLIDEDVYKRQDCDYTVKIPMAHGVDSLNVAAASAVAFWELGKRPH